MYINVCGYCLVIWCWKSRKKEIRKNLILKKERKRKRRKNKINNNKP